jgi:autotransporter strand-loop-strand O-heptosyltransferase
MQYNLNHVDGLYFEILNDNHPDKGREYEVSFFDKKSNELLYYCHLKNKQWARLNRKWFSDIKIVVKYKERIVTETSSFAQIRGKRVFINFESKSLGDTIAWIPYCDKFREYFNCEVIVSTFHNYLFENSYPKLTFVGRGVIVNNIFAKFDLGWFFDSSKEPNNPILIPLQKSASDILGLGTYEEIRPLIDFDFQSLIRPMPEKYVCISTRSTSGCKEWDEWQSLIDFLVESGYKVCEVSYEETNYSNTTEVSDKSLQTVMQYIHHSEFFIGLSSGLSWLSWGLRKTVVMISNFSKNDHEFQEGCIRITNENVCHGCWNEPKFKFNKGDWYWCPEHEDTPRHFECHKRIKPDVVIKRMITEGLIME